MTCDCSQPANTVAAKTVAVRRGEDVTAKLSSAKVLRFERKLGAMRGTPVVDVEDGAISLYYADGASIRITS